MPVPEAAVEKVVKSVSKKMRDPSYAQVAVGSFVEAQPDLTQFVTAQSDDLGGTDAVVMAIFHAEVLAECFRAHTKRELRAVGFPDLDQVATKDPLAKLGEEEPALASYVASNIDGDKPRAILAHVALALRRG